VPEQKRKLKPIEQCPDGHYYNTDRTGDICDVCGKKLDPPDDEITEENIALDETQWACGILVCVKGVNKGRVYPIKADKNFIGSTSSMDIHITGDKKIEKKNHAVIVYDAMEKTTSLIPTETRGMVYWKKKAIFEMVTLEPYDEIMLGESTFKFAPFCGADFTWESVDDVD